VANIKSQEKRIRTNERARLRNQSVKSALRTAIRGFREAVEAGEKEKAGELLIATNRKLDKAATKGVIHKNQAANKKSALTLAFNKLLSEPVDVAKPRPDDRAAVLLCA
jgi:small subunit ribosomal protein S20